MLHIEGARMKRISGGPVMRKITPWIVGVTIVCIGIFFVGIAEEHRTWLGAGAAFAVLLIGVLTVFK